MGITDLVPNRLSATGSPTQMFMVCSICGHANRHIGFPDANGVDREAYVRLPFECETCRKWQLTVHCRAGRGDDQKTGASGSGKELVLCSRPRISTSYHRPLNATNR